MSWHNMVFYEAVTTTVKLEPLDPDDPHSHDEVLFGESWTKMTGSCVKELRQNLTQTEALQQVVDQVEALPPERYLFVMYFLVGKQVRIGFYRSPNASLLEWGDSECPPWCQPPVEGPSRYDLLMEDE